ncbi:hypothetical protein PILCRDRAFT_809899 [Piloderma croceum F 1598]|uniref:Subtilisin-like serine protease n=1 Tax=Piloderma croceum (strain F 1598) TaxID=765440 RepID=A0A0C3CQG9_PILCF|nr:hypothetical protein PILCRDRAFT_809899 [Piloderma croceum F 1598]
MAEPPFCQAVELNNELSWMPSKNSLQATETNRFGINCVPSQPLISIDDVQATLQFLGRDLLHHRLNTLFPIFWLVSTPQSSHISPLHHQAIRGREIVITEDPGLHLLWYNDKIYIKPLPQYLTNYAFWKYFLSETTPDLRKAALGYVRSYSYLVLHQSDFDIAVEKKLISGTMDFAGLLYFLRSFRDINDDAVTPRYQYGELRLNRLNFFSRFYRFELFYHEVHWRYDYYFAQIVAPIVVVFATVSVALAAMQVVLAAEQLGHTPTWTVFISTSQWFSVICLFLAAACIVFFPVILCIFLARELAYALLKMHS